MRFMQGVFLLCLGLLVAFGACRRNRPSLVDTNERPETVLWYAPPDSMEYEYLVHMYWRGEDNDGTAVKFIWAMRDSVDWSEESWDPSTSLSDFREGRIINRTDSVFAFKAFIDVGGVGVKKNRQAFYIAAIDDIGAIDETPARVEFVATIGELPRIVFSTHMADNTGKWVSKPYTNYDIPKDTVGILEPFDISYHGMTTNGLVRAYKFFPLTTGVFVDGQDEWTEELGDTLRKFENTEDDFIPSSVFKFAAICVDDAQAESPVDAGNFSRGVCRIVVNWDPDTVIHGLTSSYTIDNVVYEEPIDFNDPAGIPDTVPYNSWVLVEYTGEDDDRDGKIKCNEFEPDSCIGFRVAYTKNSDRVRGSFEFSLWQPRDGVHDTDPHSSTDSNTFHIGSLEYDLTVHAIDEHGRPDGTPPSVHIIGNYDPTLDSVVVEDHLGNRIDLSIVDTVEWNFWKGEGWPYVCECDTVDKTPLMCKDKLECLPRREYPELSGTWKFYKKFRVHIKAWGHDHPKEPTGSGLKAWRYLVKNEQNEFINLGKGTAGWFESKKDGDMQVNELDDVIIYKTLYPDTLGDSVFENLPSWLDQELTFFLLGRDTSTNEGDFQQSIFINGQKSIINEFASSDLGRWTEERVFAFRIRLVR
ncbi:MAG: hypothetical protein KAT30_08770 [Candidatus Krumholzibacteria bacterium]|nr:hypothetical protein [Candidatus Krumholzibacteria bacterium]